MSSTWSDSPVAETCAAVLDAVLSGDVARRQVETGKACFVASFREDFDYLWGFGTETDDDSFRVWMTPENREDLRTIVLIWDGMPPSPASTINIGDYVTPYDWAFALSWNVYERWRDNREQDSELSIQELPQLRILIIDLNSQEHSGAFALKAFLTIGSALPWIQVYRAVQTYRTEMSALPSSDDYSISLLRSVIPPGSFGLQTFFEDIASSSRILSLRDAQSESDRFAVLDSLIGLWKSHLVRPGDRHIIGNLLAPLLLAQGLPKALRDKARKKISSQNPLSNALEKLIHAIGLGEVTSASPARVPNKGILAAMGREADVFARRKSLRFLLIDDQFRLGFHHVLAYLLFGGRYGSPSEILLDGKAEENKWSYKVDQVGELRCEETAETLFCSLEALGHVEDWQAPRILDLSGGCDVLILDLRLWTKREDRETFLTRLIGICDRLGADRIRERGSPLFDAAFNRAYERASGILTDGGAELSEIEALMLLPLTLSFCDPSLPIILFSSTQQRTVVQSLSNHPNIITNFAKPILSGYGEDSNAADLAWNIQRAISTAIHLHEARCIWERLVNLEWTNIPAFEVFAGRYDQRMKMMAVYNESPGAFTDPNNWCAESWRYDAGSSIPRITSVQLRALLARHYVHYIERGLYFDFASVPWEVLEGNLTPTEVLDNPFIENPNFGFDPEDRRNQYIADFIQVVRHKKAHGHGRSPQNDDEAEEHRLATILQFLFLLDFLEGRSEPEAPLEASLDEVWSYLGVRYKHLFREKRPLHPRKLTADADVKWLDFIAFGSYRATDGARVSSRRLLSKETSDAVCRLATLLLERFWGPIDEMMRSRRELAAVVADDDGYGFLLHVAGKFYAYLDRTQARSDLKLGEDCSVSIDNYDRVTGNIAIRQLH
jgi:hypothetical protein